MSELNIHKIQRSPYPSDDNDKAIYRFNESPAETTIVNTGQNSDTNLNLSVRQAGNYRFGLPGIFGNCLDLDGATIFRTPTNLSVLSGNFNFSLQTITVSLWVRMRSQPNNGKMVTKAYRNDTTWNPPYMAYGFQMNSGFGGIGGWGVEITRAGSIATAVATNASDQFLQLYQWYHIGFTFDGLTAKLFRDGTEIRSAAFSGSIDYGSSGSLLVGGSYSGGSGEFCNGAFDDLRVTNVLRDQDWFREAYRRGLQR